MVHSMFYYLLFLLLSCAYFRPCLIQRTAAFSSAVPLRRRGRQHSPVFISNEASIAKKTLLLGLADTETQPNRRLSHRRQKSANENDENKDRASDDVAAPVAIRLSEKQNAGRRRNIRFLSPLLEYGYRPTVEQHCNGTLTQKPLLLYLPGLDGTFLCPFLQYPELDTLFDVRCLTVATDDRSTLEELRDDVLEFLLQQGSPPTHAYGREKKEQPPRPVYLAGESFGGILACEVAMAIRHWNNQNKPADHINLKGFMLINPATCFDRSVLAVQGPETASLPSWLYPLGLLRLLPLLTDEYSMDQLLLILQSKALPSVIDNETREAYLGRVALSLPQVIPYMAQETLQWRLTAWLATGCARLAANNDSLTKLIDIPSILVVGEKDQILPSVNEAQRLSTQVWPHNNSTLVHVVPDAGHASTCGSRVDLAALFRRHFDELRQSDGRTAMKPVARHGTGPEFGMEPRYDNATIGLSPFKYWSREYYQKCDGPE